MKNPTVNNQIRAPKVRLISEKGENLGIISREEALQYAKERNLDLIQITSNVPIPVCRVMDIGKYLYQQKKKEKEQRKKQKSGKIKGIRISPRIAEHDLETKVKSVSKFLLKGYKIRIEVFLKGREKGMRDFAKQKLEYFLQKLEKEVEIKKESDIKKTPRGMEIIISKR
ncbi:MAG TPA: translation initiation factor IF-3 [Candidatus Pacearchaeota archaeon]|nr:translation initiation factor IF-3 [Candidatus Pacearchaeota archaeon]HPZ75304.1 translation initiation factor IF-3 [Candidatus Pacearchaeota archaeon]